MKHIQNLFVFTFFFIGYIQFSWGRKLPSNINRCKYSTDKVEVGDCMWKEFTRLKEDFLKGMPELHLPQFDPYHIDKVEFSTAGNNNAMSFSTILTNVYMYGSKDIILVNLTVDLENVVVNVETHFHLAYLTADYQIKGNILVLPLDSTGKAQINYTELHTHDVYTGRRYKKNDKEYIIFEKGHADATIQGMQVYFDNIINGNPELTKSTNKVLNENNESLLEEMKPAVGETFASIRLNLMNTMFTRYSLDELFVYAK